MIGGQGEPFPVVGIAGHRAFGELSPSPGTHTRVSLECHLPELTPTVFRPGAHTAMVSVVITDIGSLLGILDSSGRVGQAPVAGAK